MMKKLNFFLALCLGFSCLSLHRVCLAQSKEELRAIGRVVGFDRFASLTNITSAPQSQTIILKLDKILKGRQSRSYVVVVYDSWKGKPSLPEEMFNGKSKWKFYLTRKESCDSEWQNIVSLNSDGESQVFTRSSRFEWITSKPDIANNVKLPCYALESYKMLNKEK